MVKVDFILELYLRLAIFIFALIAIDVTFVTPSRGKKSEAFLYAWAGVRALRRRPTQGSHISSLRILQNIIRHYRHFLRIYSYLHEDTLKKQW